MNSARAGTMEHPVRAEAGQRLEHEAGCQRVLGTTGEQHVGLRRSLPLQQGQFATLASG